MRWPLVAAAGLLAYAGWEWSRQQESAVQSGLWNEINDAADDAAALVQSVYETMTINLQNALGSGNVQAFLMLIRTGEGTADSNGYRRLYGGRLFDSFADHPRAKITAGGWTSTAAGAYQFLSRTWDECRAALNLPDFGPDSQDMAAVYLIRRRGALGDVLAGRFEQAIKKCNKEWASLPGSPYGQPTLTMGRALAVLESAGGEYA